MKLNKLTKKLAMVSAVALTLGISSTSANAQTTENVTASVTVQNGFTDCAGSNCNGHQHGDPISNDCTANGWYNSVYSG